MKFINYDHFKKFNDLRSTKFDWIHGRDKKSMTVLYIMSGNDDLCSKIDTYLTPTGFAFKQAQEEQELSLKLETLLNLSAALYEESHVFNVSDLSYLDNGNFELALHAIQYRYKIEDPLKYDTKPTYSVIEEPMETTKKYYGLTNFADYIKEKGLDFDRRKLSVYRSRGLLPTPTAQVGRSYGWTIDQIDEWIERYNNGEIVSRYKRDDSEYR